MIGSASDMVCLNSVENAPSLRIACIAHKSLENCAPKAFGASPQCARCCDPARDFCGLSPNSKMPHDEFWNAASALAAVIYCMITAVTLVLLVIQVREARRNVLAEFINELGRDFSEFSDVFDAILIGGDKAEPTRHQLLACLRFFERIKTLCDVGMLDIAIVDGMFGYQFFCLVNHPRVQESVLFLDGHFFPEIFALHSQLVQYRKRSGYQIPAAQNDFASKDPVRYKMNLDLCREKRLKAKR